MKSQHITPEHIKPEHIKQWVPDWASCEVAVRGRLPSLSNQSYLVAVDNKKYVVRKNDPRLGVDRKFEAKVMWFAAAAKICPEIHYQTDHVLVTPWWAFDPLTLEQAKQKDNLVKVALTLKRVHDWKIQGPTLDPTAAARSYMAQLSQPTQRQRTLLAEVVSAQQALSTMDRPLSLCHNDPLHSNWLQGETLHLLDWEYSALGDPGFDLAMFAYYHTLDMTGVEHLLHAYFEQPLEKEFEAFRLNLILARGLSQLWHDTKQAQSIQSD